MLCIKKYQKFWEKKNVVIIICVYFIRILNYEKREREDIIDTYANCPCDK